MGSIPFEPNGTQRWALGFVAIPMDPKRSHNPNWYTGNVGIGENLSGPGFGGEVCLGLYSGGITSRYPCPGPEASGDALG